MCITYKWEKYAKEKEREGYTSLFITKAKKLANHIYLLINGYKNATHPHNKEKPIISDNTNVARK